MFIMFCHHRELLLPQSTVPSPLVLPGLMRDLPFPGDKTLVLAGFPSLPPLLTHHLLGFLLLIIAKYIIMTRYSSMIARSLYPTNYLRLSWELSVSPGQGRAGWKQVVLLLALIRSESPGERGDNFVFIPSCGLKQINQVPTKISLESRVWTHVNKTTDRATDGLFYSKSASKLLSGKVIVAILVLA